MKPNLNKIIADNLDKTSHISNKGRMSLPVDGVLNEYKRGGILSRTVTCSNCGHSWKGITGGIDPMTCHKCGGMIKMKNGGEGPGDDVLQNVYAKWPALKKLGKVTIKPDESFTREKTGEGDIEFFAPNTLQVNYSNGYVAPHPGPGTYGILYNPTTNDDENIRLDMLHGMPEADRHFRRLRNRFERAVGRTDIKDEMNHWYNIDKEKGNAEDGQQQWMNNYTDGQLRTLLFEGDRDKQNYSDKEANQLLSHPNIKKKFDKLNNYLQRGEYGGDISIPQLPQHQGPLLQYYYAKTGGTYISDKAKATQFGQYANGGSSWMLTNPKPQPVIFPRMADGGPGDDELAFQQFFKTLPLNLRKDSPDYNIRGYWDSLGRPKTFDYTQPKEDDGYYHAFSRNPQTGEILKSPQHHTFKKAIDEDRKAGYFPIVTPDGKIKTVSGNDLKPGQSVYAKGGVTTQTTTLPQATQDSVRHLAGQMMDYEARKGSPIGTGLSDWGYHSSQMPNNQVPSNWHAPQTRDQAVDLYMQEIGTSPILGNFSTAMEKGEAGDFLYNTGRDPRVYMLDQYLKSSGKGSLPNRGSYNVDTKTSAWTPELQSSLDQAWNQYSGEINKLPVNQRRQLLNKGRDFYYQNINQVNGQPNPSYNATWKPRIWESVNQYKANGGEWLNKYAPGGVTGDPNQPYHPITNPEGYHTKISDVLKGVENRQRQATLESRGSVIKQGHAELPYEKRDKEQKLREQAQQNSELAQTMGSFTPSGSNTAAGAIGAENFVNMNPLLTGPIMSTSRLYGAGRSMVDPNTFNPYFSSDNGIVGNILGGLNLAGDIGMLRTAIRKPIGNFNPEPDPNTRVQYADFNERNERVKQAWIDQKKRDAGIPITADEYTNFLKNQKLSQDAGKILRTKGMTPDPRSGGSWQAPTNELTWKDPKTGETIYQLEGADYNNFKTPELYKEAQKDLKNYKTNYFQKLIDQRNANLDRAKLLGMGRSTENAAILKSKNLLGGKFPGLNIPDYMENLGADMPMYSKDPYGVIHNVSGIDPSTLTKYSGRQAYKTINPNKYGGEQWLNRYQEGSQVSYTVKPGDNLTRIGRQFGLSPQQLADANDIQNLNKIRANQVLNIPGVQQQPQPPIAQAPIVDANFVGPQMSDEPNIQSPTTIKRVQAPITQQKVVNTKKQTPVKLEQQQAKPVSTEPTSSVLGEAPPLFKSIEDREAWRKRLQEVANKALSEKGDVKYLAPLVDVFDASGNPVTLESGENCINGICGLNKAAGLKYNSPTYADRYIGNQTFYDNVNNKKEDYYRVNGNFQVGDHIQLQNHKTNKLGFNITSEKTGKPVLKVHHSYEIIGTDGVDDQGNKLLRLIHNGGGTEFREKVITEQELKNWIAEQDPDESEGVQRYSAIVNRPGYSLDKELIKKQREASMSPKTIAALAEQKQTADWQTKHDPNYQYSIKEDSPQFKNQPIGMKKFVEFANNTDNINNLVKKLGVSKDVIHDELLNTFGELGEENKWTNPWIGGDITKGISPIPIPLESAAEKIGSLFNIGKSKSVGPGQIKMETLDDEERQAKGVGTKSLKELFGIQNMSDLQDFDKVIPLMTALNIRNRQWMERKGKDLSNYLIGQPGASAEDLKYGVGRWTPYMYRGSLRVPTTNENAKTLDEGSYADRVYHNIDNNLQRTLPYNLEDGQYRDLQPVTVVAHTKKKKKDGGEQWLNSYASGGMITDPMGQWAHPGQNTRIPGGNITMQNVNYPVWAEASNGQKRMMYPGQEYSFPGAKHVDEYPMGGSNKWLGKYQTKGQVGADVKSQGLWGAGTQLLRNMFPDAITHYITGEPTVGQAATNLVDPTGASNAPFVWNSLGKMYEQPSIKHAVGLGFDIAGSIPVFGEAAKGTKAIVQGTNALEKANLARRTGNLIGSGAKKIVNLVEKPAQLVNKGYSKIGVSSPILNNRLGLWNRGERGWEAIGEGVKQGLNYLSPGTNQKYGGQTSWLNKYK